MTEHSDALAWLSEELEGLDRRSLRRQRRVRLGAQSGTIDVDGKHLVNFGSNDYLALAADARLAEAAKRALAEDGWGAGASPLVTGRSHWHDLLEQRLAEFEGREAALVFSSGYAANVGVIAALVGREDAVFGDEKNHASIIDGCRLSRASINIYRHRDAEHLADLLRSATNFRRRLIVTDSVFSMDGDLAPLADLAELARQHGAMLMVDEAHATGVFGAGGRGLAEATGAEEGVHICIGTLSKALGSAGGFVAGSRELVEWLVNRARPYIFSTAGPPAASAAAAAAIDIVEAEPERRRALLDRATRLRERLRADGWDTGESASQIIPILVGDPESTMRLSERLRGSGLLVPGIRPPSVPQGQSLLRISLSSAHDDEMLERLVTTLARFAGAAVGRT